MLISQLLSIAILIAIYGVGELFSLYFRLPIPGAAIGLVLCTALMLGIPRTRTYLRPGGVVLLALVPLFLVPVLVRMASKVDFGAGSTWLAVGVLCFASFLGVAAVGLAA